jgi:ketosteroid isomerase-like protein
METRDIIGTFLERLGQQDADGAAELFAENIDWYVPGDEALPWTGRRNERAQVAEYFRTLWPLLVAGESTVDLDAIVVDGDDAVIFSTFAHTVKKNNRPLRNPTAMRLGIDNGLIIRMHLYEDTAAVRDAFSDR